MTKKVGAADSSSSSEKASPPSVRSNTRTAQRPPPIPGVAAKPPPIPGADRQRGAEREGLPKSGASPTRSKPPAPLPPRPRAASPDAVPPARPVASPEQRSHQIESIGRGLGELHALLAAVADELEALRVAERTLTKEGAQKLLELASSLRRAAGQAPSVRPAARPKGPPPIPGTEPSPSSRHPSSRPRAPMRSTMDISEIAELIESMAPPPLEPLPSVDIDDESW